MTERRGAQLTEHERRRLRSIEADLVRDDPELAAAFGDDRRTWAGLDWALGASALGGSATLGAGLLADTPVVGAIGFAILVAAIDRLAERHELARRVADLVRDQFSDESSSAP